MYHQDFQPFRFMQYWMAILNKEKGYVTNLSSESESANKRCYL